MSTAWPDDVQIGARNSWMAASLSVGNAVCPRCLRLHRECGREHLRRPWSIAPRCTDCGERLRLPAPSPEAA